VFLVFQKQTLLLSGCWYQPTAAVKGVDVRFQLELGGFSRGSGDVVYSIYES
jgi:hypothetical protein